MASPVSHDQNFKNLILDYPREALAFFAADEAQEIDAGVTITPLRQEQLKERLGERFRELDVPLAALLDPSPGPLLPGPGRTAGHRAGGAGGDLFT